MNGKKRKVLMVAFAVMTALLVMTGCSKAQPSGEVNKFDSDQNIIITVGETRFGASICADYRKDGSSTGENAAYYKIKDGDKNLKTLVISKSDDAELDFESAEFIEKYEKGLKGATKVDKKSVKAEVVDFRGGKAMKFYMVQADSDVALESAGLSFNNNGKNYTLVIYSQVGDPTAELDAVAASLDY
ncbi:MAG: hypothetical protein IIY88_06770 [Eubacterium sp.]|nr:hypothetical protein [Eubacterium sp.]